MKDSLRASPDRISGSITPPASIAVTQLTTPAGTPASVRMSISASIDNGVWWAGLTTLVQPAAIAGPILRVPIAIGKFHGVIKQARADGLAGDQEAGASGRRGLVTAVDPFRLAREVAEKLCGVSDFAAGLGQRLAHLQCHQQRQVVDPLVHQLERAGEHVGPISWRGRGERGLRGDGRLQRGPPVCGRGVGHRAQRLRRWRGR